MSEVVPEGAERTVDVPGLPALVAMGADQGGTAVEAGIVSRPLALAGRGLDGPSGEPARHRFADIFEAPCDHLPFMTEARRRVETL